MIDFEQLKISNVDLTEKVEERNEDITKLTGKVRATVEVLTHVKEKLHFLQVVLCTHTHSTVPRGKEYSIRALELLWECCRYRCHCQ